MAKGRVGVNTSSIIHLKKPERVKCDCSRCQRSSISVSVLYCGYYDIISPNRKSCVRYLPGKRKVIPQPSSIKTNVQMQTKAPSSKPPITQKPVAPKPVKPVELPVVKLATIQHLCEAKYITIDFLKHCKTKMQPGNGWYQIQCIKEDPLTVKIRGRKGAGKHYLVVE